MWTLSGFVDEISADFETQCSVAAGLGLKYVEIRSAWGVNILDLDDDQLATVQETLDRHGLKVSSIGSPIGKIDIDEDFEPHLERARHAADVAKTLGAPYIRLFSFFIRRRTTPRTIATRCSGVCGRSPTSARPPAWSSCTRTRRTSTATPRSAASTSSSRSARPNLRVAWDPANFVQVGVRPFTEGYASLRPHLEYMQIKDAHAADGTVTVAGDGDGQLVETIRALREDGFDGFFSLEPHLGDVHALGGFSGPELFTRAHAAFTGLLHTEGIEYA